MIDSLKKIISRVSRVVANWRITLLIAVYILLFFLVFPLIDRQGRLGLAAKTLWDWLDLLIVPAILAGGALWFNSQARERENVRADDRDRETMLQRYFDSMLEMKLKQGINGQEINPAIKMRTTAVLRRMDSRRAREVLNFLRAYKQLNDQGQIDLTEVNLSLVNLSEFDLSKSDLTNAKLNGADLRGAILDEATLVKAELNGADLRKAQVVGSRLQDANLSWADMRYVEMGFANLTNANLKGADLRNANLKNAVVKDLIYDETTKFNKHTTLPDGAKWTPRTDLSRYTEGDIPSTTT